LGATLYELLTLESPYPADSPARLVKLLADTDPRPASSWKRRWKTCTPRARAGRGGT